MAFTQAAVQVFSIFFITFAFKFALLADLNQGCVPSLFAVYGIYVSVVFYFCFGEIISISKIIGIVLIIVCVVFMAFD